MTLAPLAGDRVAVIHCPQSYQRIEIEEAETGEILGTRESRHKMEFHSRLSVSPDGRLLLSAGWWWHPVNGVWVCIVEDTAKGPAQEFAYAFGAEIDGAAFLGSDHVAVSTTVEQVDEEVPAAGLGPMKLGVWSIPDKRWNSVVDLAEFSGTIMPWRDWVISFYGHPKAIELATGAVVHRWDQIDSGRQVGPIDLGDPRPPVMALDPQGGRFAVNGPRGITVVTLSACDQEGRQDSGRRYGP